MAGSLFAAWASSSLRTQEHVRRRTQELNQLLLWIIASRAVILFLGLNLANPLGILPEGIGPLPFLPFFNVIAVTLTLGYLALWWNGGRFQAQLYLQICIDLVITTVLVSFTQGLESPFVSFYLLIVIYCSLTQGRNGGMIGAALSTILFAGVAGWEHLGFLNTGVTPLNLENLTFRISLVAIGFVSVAFLGTSLSQRLHTVQEELEEKIDSLKQLRRLNEHIVRSIRSGLITTDLEGRITLINRTSEELTESNGNAALGRHIQSVIDQKLWEKIVSTNFFKDIRPLRHEDWVEVRNGVRRFLGFSVSPLMNEESKLIGYIVSFQDLTEIKNLEEEIRLKDRMATIGRMAAGIAHEIRNPLMSMRGSVEILRSHVHLPKTDDRLLEILMRESDRLNEFVEDLLHFARPGKSDWHPVDLVSLLRDSVTLLSNSPEVRSKYSVDLVVHADPIRILGNSDKLKQVFWNLAQNGMRAMPDGGTLKIQATKGSDGMGCILFRDEGVGMTAEEKNRLFQPFQSGFSKGTGLGLSIIFQIIEDHKGKIHFESEKGKGTRVTLQLPLESQARFVEDHEKDHVFHPAC
jgi:two-component system sensor histidine kinase PilS (NtrC family)